MPRAVVVLPSTTYRAGDFVAAADSLGIDLVVASEQPPPFDMGDGYIQIDCSDPARAADSLARLGDEVPLDGVVAADDTGVVVAAMVGTSLGLPSNTPEAAAASRDKLDMRKRLSQGEVPQPHFLALPAEADPLTVAGSIGYPVVLKPRDRSASQGVLRVDSAAGITETVERIRRILGDPKAELVVEAFMTGVEVAVEGIVRDGELTILAVFDKPDTSSGPGFPETLFVTPSRLPEEDLAEAYRVSEAALRALGLDHGPVHIELKVEDGTARVIEVAARSIGGLCSRSLDFGLMGTTLETLILRNAVGMDKPELKRAQVASGVLMIPIPAKGRLAEVTGLAETREVDGVTGVDITARPGDLIAPPPEGDRYIGFVFARAKSPGEVETALRRANELLTVRVDDAPEAQLEV